MGVTVLGSEEQKFALVIVALLVLAITGAILHIRNEWKAVRHKLFKLREGLAKPARPSRVVERLMSGRWNAALSDAIARAKDESAAEEENLNAALEALIAAEGSLRPIVDSIAIEAMTTGDLKSALVRIDELLVYVLVFPGRHEDRRSFRRYQAFSDGWRAHSTAVRHTSMKGENAPPMISLLYFLGLDAHDGTLLIAYDRDDEHRYPAELAEVLSAPAIGKGETSRLTYEFALA
jgi:hypothetical protein